MEAAHAAHRQLAALESVRCLDCGEVYSKPVQGGTTQKNPGCPVCGYVGWIPISLPGVQEGQGHSGAGRHMRRLVRLR